MSFDISKSLIDWFQRSKRDLPWRRTKNPYHIWVSEVMLQQTQVATVIPYYHRFLERFPTIQALAEADSNELMKVWEGLGYYARARHLQAAARQILSEYGGQLPTTRAALRRLKGFGDYTSASVASLAFGEDCLALDGNALRVFSRLFGIREDIRQRATRLKIESLAQPLLPKGQAGIFNEAVMELGATVCTPKLPHCGHCPLQTACYAFQHRLTDTIPYKSSRSKAPHYHIAVGVVHRDGKVLIARRKAEGFLGNLWEFPGGKLQSGETLASCCQREIREETSLEVSVGEKFAEVKHAYTHFKITLHAFHCTYLSGEALARSSQEVRWVSPDELRQYPFPKANQAVIDALLRPTASSLSLFT
ncbi:MAG: A/G-specific adenine glycosylase [Chloroherpetonaceae bacterium]|nr:A/G-specific adenine glycosylase [Chloroherpetonaceae bacterium]MCS7210780.1 A/G-specific adenine glycosylase [Chloroherpetonaceae bacterium]MDW8019265.1 A/G-specific adenine glycosylase [Chloroherpetonaceae bacterium]MDW8466660.1 A/G-specific adenine glycosylase [Chloroherpetonaceae bacterium]